MTAFRIEELSGTPSEVLAEVEPLLLEYLAWCADRLLAEFGIADDEQRIIDRHHESFRRELPNVLGARGGLVIARLAGEPVGVGALKPVDAEYAELKRMYVCPGARGQGIGRAILTHLLQAAVDRDFRAIRLETSVFMTEAVAMYRSLGFEPIDPFPGETDLTGFGHAVRFLQLEIARRAPA